MKTVSGFFVILCVFLLWADTSFAGPFTYGEGHEPYPGIPKDDPALVGWATGWVHYLPGPDVDAGFQTPEKALGPALGNSYHVVSLGRGGSIIMSFDPPLRNGEGWDLAIFENSFSDTFLELAYVEVSSDGEHFVRFDCCSLTPAPVSAFGSIEASNITGLAGKYRQGIGTPFDLQDLADKQEARSCLVNLNSIAYVKIVDIVGDGTCYDDRSGELKVQWGENAVIYDPYPTITSAGFDLEAVGVRYQNTTPGNLVIKDLAGEIMEDFNIGLNRVTMEPSCPQYSSYTLLQDSHDENKTVTAIHRRHPASGLIESAYWFFDTVCGVNFPILPQMRYTVFRSK